jgi:hypothetical protein
VSSIETGAESLTSLVFHSFHLLLVTADQRGYVRVQNAADGSMLNTFHVTNGARVPMACAALDGWLVVCRSPDRPAVTCAPPKPTRVRFLPKINTVHNRLLAGVTHSASQPCCLETHINQARPRATRP